MKQMEYTVKVTTDGPVDPASLVSAVIAKFETAHVEVTNYRVKPVPRKS